MKLGFRFLVRRKLMLMGPVPDCARNPDGYWHEWEARHPESHAHATAQDVVCRWCGERAVIWRDSLREWRSASAREFHDLMKRA